MASNSHNMYTYALLVTFFDPSFRRRIVSGFHLFSRKWIELATSSEAVHTCGPCGPKLGRPGRRPKSGTPFRNWLPVITKRFFEFVIYKMWWHTKCQAPQVTMHKLKISFHSCTQLHGGKPFRVANASTIHFGGGQYHITIDEEFAMSCSYIVLSHSLQMTWNVHCTSALVVQCFAATEDNLNSYGTRVQGVSFFYVIYGAC